MAILVQACPSHAEKPMHFKTPRLQLRPIEAADAALYVGLYGDPAVMHHIGEPLSAAAAARAFEATLRQVRQNPPALQAWILSEPAAAADIGLLALARPHATAGIAELGTMLLGAGQGRGLAVEAQEVVLDQEFWSGRLQLAWSRHAPANRAAAGLMLKLGFARMDAAGAEERWQMTSARWRTRKRISGVWRMPPQTGRLRGMDAPSGGRRMQQHGSLACVGLGMMLGAHLGPRARSHIERADVVFVLVSDPLVELWLQELRADARSLQPYYGEGKSRQATYREMVEAMLDEVRHGRTVCGVFYGHPGVFAVVPHRAIERAREEGFSATMEPGISAEDCLYADLGIDPGTFGCQHYEASQYMFYQRRIDPSALLVLWQVGVAGDRSFRRFATGAEYRRLLVAVLAQDYPLTHEVIAYEAATLPIATPRMQRMPLSGIVEAELGLHTTLVIPPARAMQPNQAVLDRLAELDAQAASDTTPFALQPA